MDNSVHFRSVQSLSHVWLFESPGTAAHQDSFSLTNSWSLLKFISIESVIPSNHLTLSSPSTPTFNFSQHQDLFKWVSSLQQVAKISEFQLQHQSFQWIFRADLLKDGLVGSPCSRRDSQECFPTPQFKHQFFGTQLSLYSNSHIHTLLSHPYIHFPVSIHTGKNIALTR